MYNEDNIIDGSKLLWKLGNNYKISLSGYLFTLNVKHSQYGPKVCFTINNSTKEYSFKLETKWIFRTEESINQYINGIYLNLLSYIPLYKEYESEYLTELSDEELTQHITQYISRYKVI